MKHGIDQVYSSGSQLLDANGISRFTFKPTRGFGRLIIPWPRPRSVTENVGGLDDQLVNHVWSH